MLFRFLLGFASVGLFALVVALGLALQTDLADFDWLIAGGVSVAAGTVGGGVAVVREIIASRRPLVGHTLRRSRLDSVNLWDWFPW